MSDRQTVGVSIGRRASGFSVCIDFGTAASKIALGWDEEDGARRALALAIGEAAGAQTAYWTPSSVFIDDERLFFGPAARARAAVCDDDRREELTSFKTILGAKDLDAALDAPLRPHIDPTRTLSYRDIIVLYLAYLLHLSSVALAQLGRPQLFATARRRYTHPAYRAQERTYEYHRVLFNEAQFVVDHFGASLAGPEGARVIDARGCLKEAQLADAQGRLEGDIYEAHAAALAHGVDIDQSIDGLVVLDMGAGTTDIAAFVLDHQADGLMFCEVEGGTRSIALACDEVDAILLDIFLRKWGASKSLSSQNRLWRSMSRSARTLKEEIFAFGKVSLDHEGKTLTVRMGELTHDRRFTDFQAALAGAFLQSLNALASVKPARPAPFAVLTGGGAHLAFVEAIARRAKAKGAKWNALEIATMAPRWIEEAGADEHLIASFPQLAIALGGALARLGARGDRPASLSGLKSPKESARGGPSRARSGPQAATRRGENPH